MLVNGDCHYRNWHPGLGRRTAHSSLAGVEGFQRECPRRLCHPMPCHHLLAANGLVQEHGCMVDRVISHFWLEILMSVCFVLTGHGRMWLINKLACDVQLAMVYVATPADAFLARSIDREQRWYPDKPDRAHLPAVRILRLTSAHQRRSHSPKITPAQWTLS
jgi:hypothetical protein